MPHALREVEPDNPHVCNPHGPPIGCFQFIPWTYRATIWRIIPIVRVMLKRREIMKKFSATFIILTLAFTLVMVFTPVYALTDKVVLRIEGMTWATWPFIIRKALEGLEGVEKASISFSKKRGEVFFDPAKVSEKNIVNKVNELGFRARVVEE